MAGELKKLFVLCLVAAFLAQFEIRAQEAQSAISTETTAEPTTTAAAGGTDATTTAAATTAEPTTTAAAGGTDATTTAAATTAEPTTTAAAGGTDATTAAAATTAEPTTTAAAGGTDATTAAAATTAEPTATAATGGTDGTTATDATGGTGGTTKPQPTEPTDPCASIPCGDGSTCDPRHGENYVCLCLAGEKYNYDTKRCESAKVFPGELSLPKLTYEDGMRDKTSSVFINTASKIVSEVELGFKDNTDYSGATVLELLPIENSRATEGVKATVEIIFEANAVVDENTVQTGIDTAVEAAADCKDCALQDAKFIDKPLCDSKPCDEVSSTCKSSSGTFTCNCNDGYIKTNFSMRMCIACPSGKEAKDGTECIACSFGYSGFNCNESWQLVLTIVGSILSGLLLVTLILLPVVALKSTKKRSKKSKEDIGMSQVNQPSTKIPMANSNFSNSHTAPANGPANGFPNSGMPRIPRAGTNNPWDSRTNLDMTPSNSRQNLIPASKSSRFDDDDDTGPYAQIRPQGSLYSQAQSQNSLYAQTRPQSNPYAQTRPQSNPYAQTRPQSNPYASSQGQSSPHFAQDLGRRY